VDKIKSQNITSYLQSLEERAKKLRKEADYWEINPNIRKTKDRIKIILEFFKKEKLSEREKNKLLRLTKHKLTNLNKHISSVNRAVQKNPEMWGKKLRDTENELEQVLTLYEKLAPVLFRKKQK